MTPLVSKSGRIWHLRNFVMIQGRQPALYMYRIRQGAIWNGPTN